MQRIGRRWGRFKCCQQQTFQRFGINNKDFCFKNQLFYKNSTIRYKIWFRYFVLFCKLQLLSDILPKDKILLMNLDMREFYVFNFLVKKDDKTRE